MLSMLLTLVSIWLLLLLVEKLQKRVSRRGFPWWLRLLLFGGGVWSSWQLLGCYPQAMDVLSLAGLPILTYVLLSFGETMLIMQTSMVDTLQEDYIITAWAKGLPARTVRDKHAARNALLPVFSRLIVSLPYLLTGLVIIEQVFEWPGFSTALFNALYSQDMPIVMGGLLLVGVLSLLMRLLLDVVQLYLDPRIRYRLEQQGRL
ncbi:MAG: ABC transporter permease [Anaerolineae bacterium]|nr:ABC transporter permease [Anaerolineae bacterium]